VTRRRRIPCPRGARDRRPRPRNPYIDPIHRLQVELLRRARAEPQGLDALERPLLLSVQGIAAGVRNTG